MNESILHLWKCHYTVESTFQLFDVVDYIWSVYKPSDDSIGHYWQSLHYYKIMNPQCVLLENPDSDVVLNCRLYNFRNK